MIWYDRIEEPIRSLVKLLRDNGYNTFTSCGHNMWVGMYWERYFYDADKFFENLAKLLRDNGYKNYHIFGEILHEENDNYRHRSYVTVCLPLKNGRYSQQVFQQFKFRVYPKEKK